MKLRTTNRRLNRVVRRSAFTLMEMMVVVSMIVALAGLGIFYMAGQADKANETKAYADVKSLQSACTAYKFAHSGQWPPSLEALLEGDGQGNGPYLQDRAQLLDPWKNPYIYDIAGPNNRGMFPDISANSQQFGPIGNWPKKN